MSKSHHTERLLPFSPQQLYDLVEDVQRYLNFCPGVWRRAFGSASPIINSLI